MKVKPAHLVEYALIRVVAVLVCLLPYRVALCLGWILARLSFGVLRLKMETVRGRVREILGEGVSEQRVRQIVWIAWRNLVFSGIEMLQAPRYSMTWVKKVTDYTKIEKVTATIASAGNVIVAVPHMGSWELASLSAGLFGLDLVFITRAQKNPLTGAYLNRIRSRSGQKCVDRDDPRLIKTVLRKIKQGRVLVILPDIRARTNGLQVRFLGKEVQVGGGMAMFARQTRVPIIPACIIREGWARHKWMAFDPVRPDLSLDKKEDWQRMTQQVLDVFTQVIAKQPEQYFWFNKKWILDSVTVL